MHNRRFLFYLLIPSLIFSIAFFAQKVDMKKLEGMKPRSIGPEMYTCKEKVQRIISNEEKITRYLWQAQYSIASSPDAHGENARIAISLLKKDFGKGLDRINRFFDTEWDNYRQKVDGTKLILIKESKKFLL